MPGSRRRPAVRGAAHGGGPVRDRPAPHPAALPSAALRSAALPSAALHLASRGSALRRGRGGAPVHQLEVHLLAAELHAEADRRAAVAHRVGDGLRPDPQQRRLHRRLHQGRIGDRRIDPHLRPRIAVAQAPAERGPVQGDLRQGAGLLGREHPDHRAQIPQRRMGGIPRGVQGAIAGLGILEGGREGGVQRDGAEMPRDHVVQVMGDAAPLGLHRMGGARAGELVLETGQMLRRLPGPAMMAHLPAPQQRRHHRQRRDHRDQEDHLHGLPREQRREHPHRRQTDRKARGELGEAAAAVHHRLEHRLEQQDVGEDLPACDDLRKAQRSGHRERDRGPAPAPDQARAADQHQRHRDPQRPGPPLGEEARVAEAGGGQHQCERRVPGRDQRIPPLQRRGHGLLEIGRRRRGGHARKTTRHLPARRPSRPGLLPREEALRRAPQPGWIPWNH